MLAGLGFVQRCSRRADGAGLPQTSPISIGVPAGDEADLVLDMGASFGLGLELFESVPSLQGAFFKNLAVGTAGTVVLYSCSAARQTK
eukprot:COSAG04_NODE_988_length_8943_cov_36.879579_2_plen_88_part_00